MENKKEFSEKRLGILIVTLIVAIILVLLFVILNYNSEPHFKIYKKECLNDTSYTFNINDSVIKCEQVEVEEILIIKTKKECFKWANREDVSDEDYLNYGIPCIDLRDKNETIKISKEDLTIKWLDENCGLPYTYQIGNERYEEEVNYYYNCGDYQIEIWNQIK